MNKLREAAERIATWESKAISGNPDTFWKEKIDFIDSVIRESAIEAVKDARHKWMSKADPFVQECIKLAEETGRSEAIEECLKIVEDHMGRIACDEVTERVRALKP